MYLKNVDLKLDLYFYLPGDNELTHWGRVTHICVSKLTIIASDNGLSPGRRQAIIWTNAGILLLIGPLGTNFSEILIGIQTFPYKKLRLRMSSAKWRPSCLGLNELEWTLSIFHSVISLSQWIFFDACDQTGPSFEATELMHHWGHVSLFWWLKKSSILLKWCPWNIYEA